MEKEVGFVYKWYDTKADMYYIGSHKGDVNDGYKGSGKLFKRAYNERPSDFFREILYIGEEYCFYEEAILTYLNARDDEQSYNLKNKAVGAGFKHTEESKRKISEAGMGRRMSDKNKKHLLITTLLRLFLVRREIKYQLILKVENYGFAQTKNISRY